MVDNALYLLKTRGDAQECVFAVKTAENCCFLLKTSLRGQRRVIVGKSSVRQVVGRRYRWTCSCSP